MHTIARFQTPEEAHLFRSFLEAREIPAYVFDEHMVQLCWHYSNAIGGVRVVVSGDDFEEASQALEEYRGAIRSGPSMVASVRGWPVVLLLSIFLGMPVLLFGRSRATY